MSRVMRVTVGAAGSGAVAAGTSLATSKTLLWLILEAGGAVVIGWALAWRT